MSAVQPVQWQVRLETPADEDFLRRLFAATHGEIVAQLRWPGAQLDALMDMQYEAQNRHYRATYPAARAEIVLAHQQAIGRVLSAERATDLLLIDLALLPEYRGAGVGAGLLRSIQQRARHARKDLILRVDESNPARRLYHRLGFVETDQRGLHVEMRWRHAFAPPDPHCNASRTHRGELQ